MKLSRHRDMFPRPLLPFTFAPLFFFRETGAIFKPPSLLCRGKTEYDPIHLVTSHDLGCTHDDSNLCRVWFE